MFDQNEVAAGGPAGYWADVMGSFKSDAANALYQGCAAKDDMTAVIKITRPTSKFPTALSLDSFSMQSPKALKAGDANNVTKQGEGFGYPAYSQEPGRHRPLQARQVRRGQQDGHARAQRRLLGREGQDGQARLQDHPRREHPSPGARGRQHRRLRPPEPGRLEGPEGRGNNVLVRPAFNILYMGLNPAKNPKLKDLKVRQALYYALNRDQLVKTQLPEGATGGDAVRARHHRRATTRA